MPELHDRLAQTLVGSLDAIHQLTAFVGLDGFIDEVIHAVDKRDDAQNFTRLPTITSFAERIASAAGKSTNIELVTALTKLGGNGPILANALAVFGAQVTYLGNLGYPNIHAVFEKFASRAEVYSIAQPCHTDALEFDDGKIMLGKMTQLQEITWANIQERFGRDRFTAKFNTAKLVAFVNWTMIPFMNDLWEALLQELCPILTPPRQWMFFDLADPAKREQDDIERALALIQQFQKHFDVLFGMNVKEADEIARVLGLQGDSKTPEGLCDLGIRMQKQLGVHTLAIHPITFAIAVTNGRASIAYGPAVKKVVITTGAGDHFNAGFCLGKLLNLDDELSLQLGVATSGYYVSSAKSPGILNLVEMLRNWPK